MLTCASFSLETSRLGLFPLHHSSYYGARYFWQAS